MANNRRSMGMSNITYFGNDIYKIEQPADFVHEYDITMYYEYKDGIITILNVRRVEQKQTLDMLTELRKMSPREYEREVMQMPPPFEHLQEPKWIRKAGVSLRGKRSDIWFDDIF